MSLEAGQVSPPQWFDARNIGSHTWYSTGATVAHLGTASPHDKPSPFFDPGSWIGQNRASTIAPSSVSPGQTGRFTFRVKAPAVPGTYDAHFAPVADGPGGGWMDGQAQWSNVFLTYAVRAPAAPRITQLKVTPQAISPGEKVTVTVRASDNVAIDQVTAELGAAKATESVPYDPPYASSGETAVGFQLDSAGLGPGVHSVLVRVYDKIGQVAASTAAVQINPRSDSAAGGGRGKGRGFPRYIASFDWEAADGGKADKRIREITLLPTPKEAIGTVFCKRLCNLPYRTEKTRRGQVVFAGGVLDSGVVLRRGAVVETRVMKNGVGRYLTYGADLEPIKSGCLVRKDGDLRRIGCRAN